MIKLDQIFLPIKYTNKDILSGICKNLKINSSCVENFEIVEINLKRLSLFLRFN